MSILVAVEVDSSVANLSPCAASSHDIVETFCFFRI
jgi:hypothetical protein